MKFYKVISGLKVASFGATQYRYGGLEIDKILHVVVDPETDECAVAYDGDATVNENVIEIDQGQFEVIKAEIDEKIADSALPTVDERIVALSEELEDVKVANEQLKQESADTTLALLDLYEMLNPPA